MTSKHREEPFCLLEDWAVDVLIEDELTKTDRRLFWYLFKLDRWGERLVDLPSQSEIALALGVSRKAINQAQTKLQRLGLWDFQISKWKGRNLAGSKSGVLPKTPRVLPKTPKVLPKTPKVLPKGYTLKPKGYSSGSETPIEQGFQNPSDLSIDLYRSLSDSQRENFLEFARKKAANLPKPPALPERWIERNFSELYEQFRATPDGKSSATPRHDFSDHLQRDEWLAEIRKARLRFIAFGGPESEEPLRQQFAEWAEANNLLSIGDES